MSKQFSVATQTENGIKSLGDVPPKHLTSGTKRSDVVASEFPLLQESELVAIEKRNMALRQAGRAIVSVNLGAPGVELVLERNLEGKSTFRGLCRARKLKGKLKAAAQAYAGVLPELLQSDVDVDAGFAKDVMEGVGLAPSPADMERIAPLSPGRRKRAFQLSLNILKANWTAVRGLAYELHENHSGYALFAAIDLKGAKWRGLL